MTPPADQDLSSRQRTPHTPRDDDEVIFIEERPRIADLPLTPPKEEADDVVEVTARTRERKRRRQHDSNDDDDLVEVQVRSRRQRRSYTPEVVEEEEGDDDEILAVEKEVDRTYLYDPYDVEPIPPSACLPWLVKDARGQYPPPRDWSKIDDTIEKPVVSDLVFPDVFDDEPELVIRTVKDTRKKRKAKDRRQKDASRRQRRPTEPSRDNDDDNDEHNAFDVEIQEFDRRELTEDIAEVILDPWQKQVINGAELFRKLTYDVRLIIYHEILVSSEPVVVHTNWTKVYWRQRLGISIGLLMSCKAIYHEALPVLYGRNTFQYRIRDGGNTVATLTNINHPALVNANAGADDDDSDDSGSDWEQDHGPKRNRGKKTVTRRVTRSAAKGRAVPGLREIWLDKFAPYFRRLMIEAEYNRYDQETQSRMAEAISCFKWNPNTADSKRFQTTSLRIRMTPCRRGAGPTGYTVVDFFDKNSPVIEAIRSLDCKSVKIELDRSKLDGSYDTAACDAGQALEVIDLRLRLDPRRDGADEFWAGDKVAQQERVKKAKDGQKELNELAERIRQICELADGGWSRDVDQEDNDFMMPYNDEDEDFDDFEEQPDSQVIDAQAGAADDSGAETQPTDHGPTSSEALATAEANADIASATPDNGVEEQDPNRMDIQSDAGPPIVEPSELQPSETHHGEANMEELTNEPGFADVLAFIRGVNPEADEEPRHADVNLHTAIRGSEDEEEPLQSIQTS